MSPTNARSSDRPCERASANDAPWVVSASERDASHKASAHQGATTSEATSNRSRSGSKRTATANPAASASHAPRLYVKYSVVTNTTGKAAAAARAAGRSARARNPTAIKRPIAA